MDDDTPFHLGLSTGRVWDVDPEQTAHREVRLGSADVRDRNAALRALQGCESVVYAMRVDGGIIKIGWTTQLVTRRENLVGQILGFRPGDYDDEQAIHASLIEHRARGREFYHPTPEVMAVVNDIRGHFNLPAIAA